MLVLVSKEKKKKTAPSVRFSRRNQSLIVFLFFFFVVASLLTGGFCRKQQLQGFLEISSRRLVFSHFRRALCHGAQTRRQDRHRLSEKLREFVWEPLKSGAWVESLAWWLSCIRGGGGPLLWPYTQTHLPYIYMCVCLSVQRCDYRRECKVRLSINEWNLKKKEQQQPKKGNEEMMFVALRTWFSEEELPKLNQISLPWLIQATRG